MKFEIPNIGVENSVYGLKHATRWFIKLGVLLGVMDISRSVTKGVGLGAIKYGIDKVDKKYLSDDSGATETNDISIGAEVSE